MPMSGLWDRFRSWRPWVQVVGWLLFWPVPLVLLALARPRSRPFWGAVAAIGTFAWAAVVVSSGSQTNTVEADAPETTTSATGPPTTSTTRERIATTTTESPGLGAVPDPNATLAEYATAPALTGGLTTSGAGQLDVDALLSRVTIAPEASASSYQRSLFEHWIDANDDGCDTRAEVLRTESSTPAQVDPYGCHVLTGDWLSIYDGYTTDDPTELEVDHLVALSEAWRSGASAWSPERRRAYANDLAHPGALVAVTAAMNRSKGDSDPADWQPPNRSAWCIYATDWITVKARWQLTADQAEATALRNMLYGCGQPPTTTTAPPTTVAPAPSVPAPPPTAGSGCDPSYPGVCIPPAPPDLDCGDISYRRFEVRPPDPHRFDGDHDGIGCES